MSYLDAFSRVGAAIASVGRAPTTEQPVARARLLLAASLFGLVAQGASAQNLQDRPYGDARGSTVYEVDPESGRFRGPPISTDGQDLRAIGAVPVPTVMNGGGFGPTGNDYYGNVLLATPQGPRRASDGYVLAPAYRAPPLR